MSKEGVKHRARGLDRAIGILDFLWEQKGPLRPNEIAKGMRAPKSTIYELINTLTENNILEYCDTEGRVYLGRRLHFWGIAYLAHFDLAREARKYLAIITEETHETSQLCMLDGNKYTVVLMKEGLRQFRISTNVGERAPIPWTASGRLLLAHMSNDEIENFVPEEDYILPNKTKLGKSRFNAEVRKAVEEGFFSFDSISDTYTHCFAAPVYGVDQHCVATLCIIAPKEDAVKNYTRYKEILKRNAKEMTAKLSADQIKWASHATKPSTNQRA